MTFKQLAQLQGALVIAVKEELNTDPELILASTWKSFNKIKGRGRVEQKRNAQERVKELFDIKVTQDEADAILIGRNASHKEISFI